MAYALSYMDRELTGMGPEDVRVLLDRAGQGSRKRLAALAGVTTETLRKYLDGANVHASSAESIIDAARRYPMVARDAVGNYHTMTSQLAFGILARDLSRLADDLRSPKLSDEEKYSIFRGAVLDYMNAINAGSNEGD